METLKAEYQQAEDMLYSIRKHILAAAVIFILAALAGYFICSAVYRDSPEKIVEHLEILNGMINDKGVIDEQFNINPVLLFFNNFIAVFIAVGLGLIPFVFLPAITLSMNAVILGVMTAIMCAAGSGGLFEVVIMVLPHGIVELPALVISAALGFKLCCENSRMFLNRLDVLDLFVVIGEIIRVIVLVLLPLLLAAAIIETYITPALIAAFIN